MNCKSRHHPNVIHPPSSTPKLPNSHGTTISPPYKVPPPPSSPLPLCLLPHQHRHDGLSVGSKRTKKFSPKEKTRRVKGRRQSRSSGNKYLWPRTLAQLRCSKPSGSASAAGKCCCTDLEKKRMAVFHAKKSAKRHDENARIFR